MDITAEHTLRVFHVVAEQHLLACKLSALPWIETAHKLNGISELYPAPLRQCWTDAAGAGVRDFCRDMRPRASHAYWENTSREERPAPKLASEVVQLTVELDLLGTPVAGSARRCGGECGKKRQRTGHQRSPARSTCVFAHSAARHRPCHTLRRRPEPRGWRHRATFPRPDLRAHAHEPARRRKHAAVAAACPRGRRARWPAVCRGGGGPRSAAKPSLPPAWIVCTGAYSATGCASTGTGFAWCRACHAASGTLARLLPSAGASHCSLHTSCTSVSAPNLQLVCCAYNVGKQALDSHKSAMAGHGNACKRRRRCYLPLEPLQALSRHASVRPTGHGGSALAAGSRAATSRMGRAVQLHCRCRLCFLRCPAAELARGVYRRALWCCDAPAFVPAPEHTPCTQATPSHTCAVCLLRQTCWNTRSTLSSSPVTLVRPWCSAYGRGCRAGCAARRRAHEAQVAEPTLVGVRAAPPSRGTREPNTCARLLPKQHTPTSKRQLQLCRAAQPAGRCTGGHTQARSHFIARVHHGRCTDRVHHGRCTLARQRQAPHFTDHRKIFWVGRA